MLNDLPNVYRKGPKRLNLHVAWPTCLLIPFLGQHPPAYCNKKAE